MRQEGNSTIKAPINRRAGTKRKKSDKVSRSAAESLSIEARMETSASPRLIALSMGSPALEFEDFDRVVKQYRARVLRFLLASLGDKDLAESLTQDCFGNAYKSRGTLRGQCSFDT